MAKLTQQQIILKALYNGTKVSSMWGFRHGIVRLTNRVNELIKKGYPITPEELKTKKGVRYKIYYIDKAILKNIVSLFSVLYLLL